jgi:hypothetical protein
MKKKIAVTVCAALAAGTLAAFATEETKSAAPSNASATETKFVVAPSNKKSDARVSKIDARVTKVEERMSKLTRKETMLKPDALAKVTDEKWSKMHTYSDGAALERLKVYPTAGSQKTEEFYYDNDSLVFVFVEAEGAGKEGHDANAKGTKYYFSDKGLFAVMESGGKMVDPTEDKTSAMGAKLQRESKAFRAAGK